MAKDPSTLFYWSDWYGGTATLTRHQKGCYMDLLHAQFNNGHLSLEEIKTVLGSDFSQWNTLQKKFTKDPQGLFFNERMEMEKLKRQKFTSSRRKNLESKKSSHTDDHMEDEDENINTHSVFSLRLLSKKGELDKEAIEVSTRTIVTEELLKQFNANLINSNVQHSHFSEYKKHLVNWIPKKPTQNNYNGKQTRKGHDIEGVSDAADKVLRDYQNNLDSTGDRQSDSDSGSIEKRA